MKSKKEDIANVVYYYKNAKDNDTASIRISQLGSKWDCNCRSVVSIGELERTEWLERRTEYGNQKMWYLEGFDAYDNLTNNVIIITYIHGSGYELMISAGMYGEDGVLMNFEIGTRLADVKKKALEIIKQAYIDEKWYVIKKNVGLPNINNHGEVCRRDCLVRERVMEVISHKEYERRCETDEPITWKQELIKTGVLV